MAAETGALEDEAGPFEEGACVGVVTLPAGRAGTLY